MTPDEALARARAGALSPVWLVVGDDKWLETEVVQALRAAALAGGLPGFNDDKFTAGESPIEDALGACRVLPMMAPRRFVLLRGVDRWEKKDDGGGEKGARVTPLDQLADYAKDPSPTTVLVVTATKLHGQRRVVSAAKKGDFLVSCEPLKRPQMAAFVARLAKERGHPIDREVAEAIAEHAGGDAGHAADAIERLSLYVGPGKPIDEASARRLVTRVAQSTVWELAGALERRDLGAALRTVEDALEGPDDGIRMVGALGWSIRQYAKLESALAEGLRPNEAAAKAGVPPFRANDAARAVRSLPPGTIGRWVSLLAEADLSLKSSKRPGLAVLETMIIEMCRP